jgi:hypothetical protein
MRRAVLLFVILVALPVSAQQDDWTAVENALGRAGRFSAGVYKVSFPRTDLHVSIGKTRLEPSAALGTWMAFRHAGNVVVADGDLVVTSDELGPVTSALIQSGLEVSAIHNHLAGERPVVYYVHFFFHGELARALEGIKSALAATGTPTGKVSPKQPQGLPYDRAGIEKVLGVEGSLNGVVLGFSFPRKHPIHMHGQELAPAMGMATAINFQPSPLGVAATGDFVLRENEVAKVVKQLRQDEVLLTALHNHLLDDEPRLAFLHFWVEGEPKMVAEKLKRALDIVK